MWKISGFYKVGSLLDLIVTSVENPYQEYKHEEKWIISIILSENTTQCEFVNTELPTSQWKMFCRFQIPHYFYFRAEILFYFILLSFKVSTLWPKYPAREPLEMPSWLRECHILAGNEYFAFQWVLQSYLCDSSEYHSRRKWRLNSNTWLRAALRWKQRGELPFHSVTWKCGELWIKWIQENKCQGVLFFSSSFIRCLSGFMLLWGSH